MEKEQPAIGTVTPLDTDDMSQQCIKPVTMTDQMATVATSLQEVLGKLSRVEKSLSSVKSDLRKEHAKLREEVCEKMDVCEGEVMRLQNTVEDIKKEFKVHSDLLVSQERELRKDNTGLEEGQRQSFQGAHDWDILGFFKDKVGVKVELLIFIPLTTSYITVKTKVGRAHQFVSTITPIAHLVCLALTLHAASS